MARHRKLIIGALGFVVMLVGLQKTAWVVYNVFIDPRPAFTESTALTAGRGLVIGVLMVLLGGLLFAWRRPHDHRIDADGLTPGVEETVRELVDLGRKAEAIEAYRAATGADHAVAEVEVSRMYQAS